MQMPCHIHKYSACKILSYSLKQSLVSVKSSLSQNNHSELGFFNTEILIPELPVFTSTNITTHSIGRLVG